MCSILTQGSDWERVLSTQFDLDSLNVVYLHQPALNQGRMDRASLTCYFEILRDLSDFCCNDHVYQVIESFLSL